MIYFGIAAAVFLLDFFLKRWVDKKYARKVQHPHLKNKIVIEKYYNKGAALNFLEKKPELMTALHTCVMVALAVAFAFLLKLPGKKKLKAGIAMVLGGGASNLYDRYTKKHVVDYARCNFGPKWLRKIVFNVSDFFIFAGAIFAVLSSAEAE